MKILAPSAQSLLSIITWPFSGNDGHVNDVRCDQVRTKCKIEVERILNQCFDEGKKSGWTPKESNTFCKDWNSADWVWQDLYGQYNIGFMWQNPGTWIVGPPRGPWHNNPKLTWTNASSNTRSPTPDISRPPGWHYPDSVPYVLGFESKPTDVYARQVTVMSGHFPTDIKLDPYGFPLWMDNGVMDLALCVSKLKC